MIVAFMEHDNKLQHLLMGLVAVLIVIYAVNIVSTARISGIVKERTEEIRPAELELTGIYADCENCFSVKGVLESLNAQESLSIVKESHLNGSSEKAKELVSAIGIKRLPTIILQGEVGKGNVKDSWDDGWEKASYNGKDVVYFTPNAPYEDVETGKIKGLVKATVIKDCEDCKGMDEVLSFLRQQGVVFSGEENLVYASDRAKSIIEKSGIRKLPAVIITDDVDEYEGLVQALLESGISKKDGNYVVEALLPPYRNLSTGGVEGLVKVTYLNDSGCEGCYDVLNQRVILGRFGVVIEEESFVDIGNEDAAEILKKYNISAVPTIIVSPDLGFYPALMQVWPQVGTIEEDGYYVFRNVDVMGDFRELGEENGK